MCQASAISTFETLSVSPEYVKAGKNLHLHMGNLASPEWITRFLQAEDMSVEYAGYDSERKQVMSHDRVRTFEASFCLSVLTLNRCLW